MKQVKIAYAKCKAKMSHRPPDEIDFRLGFRAALNWFYEKLDFSIEHEELKDILEKELE